MVSARGSSFRFLSLAVIAASLVATTAPGQSMPVRDLPAGGSLSLAGPPAAVEPDPFDDALETACATIASIPRADSRVSGLLTLKPAPQEAPPAAPAASAPAGSGDSWQVTFMPFLWVAGMAGDVEVRGTRTSFDYDPLEMLETLVENFDFAASGQLAFRYGPWSLELTGMYVGLGNEASKGPIDVEVDFDQVILQVLGGYRFVHAPLDSEAGLSGPTLSIDALAGGRYSGLSAEIDLDPGPKLERDKDWFDPLLGARITLAATRSLSFAVQGLIGGFDVGSDFTWQLRTGLEWHLSECASLIAGYAWMDIDYESGNFEFDVLMYGPYLGAVFRF